MRLIKHIICATVLLATATAVGQQDPNYTFYRYNMNLVNPAYAGAHDGPEGTVSGTGSELGFNIRSQWAGVDGAPETQSVFFGTGVGKNLGLGVSIINDKTFIESQTSLAVDVSYKLKVSDATELFFGIKVGANSYNANTSGLTTFGIGSDPSLSDIDGGFTPNVGAGAYLKGEKYYLSFSVPRILSPDRLEQGDGVARLGSDRIHMYLSGGYDINIGKGVTFKPSVMARYVDSAPLSIDLTGAFLLAERFELGASYRLNEGIAGMVLIDVANWVDIGYAYEMPMDSPVANTSNGTHEIFMKLKL